MVAGDAGIDARLICHLMIQEKLIEALPPRPEGFTLSRRITTRDGRTRLEAPASSRVRLAAGIHQLLILLIHSFTSLSYRMGEGLSEGCGWLVSPPLQSYETDRMIATCNLQTNRQRFCDLLNADGSRTLISMPDR